MRNRLAGQQTAHSSPYKGDSMRTFTKLNIYRICDGISSLAYEAR